MPMPQEYQRATFIYDQILNQICDELDLATRNQTYTLLQSVLLVFRRRLTPAQILQFSSLLPPIVRAIFVKDWDENEFVAHYGSHAQLSEEVKDLRRAHNFADAHAIAGVTSVLRHFMDEEKLAATLDGFSDGAIAFWQGEKV